MTDWTAERVDRLRQLWADGLSASQIAAELGVVSRNSIIGKVHRLGLPGRPKPIKSGQSKRKQTPQEREQIAKLRRRQVLANPPLTVAQMEAMMPATPPNPVNRRTILTLCEGECKWPYGDPRDADFHFCGGWAVQTGPHSFRPYCAAHCRIAYQAVRERQEAA